MPVPAPQTIRVMTYNLHHGRGLDGKVDIARQAEVIKQERADIVALQEMDRVVERSGRVDQIGELARLTGMNFFWDKNINFQGGEYGNGLLSRFPILQQTNTHYKMIHPNEQRGLMQVVLDVNGRKLLVMNTHIDYRGDIDEERLMNVKEIKEAADRARDIPLIIMGDFNDDPWTRTHQRMRQEFVDVWELLGEGIGYTYDGPDRSKRLDYIYIRPSEALQPVRIWVTESTASDHRPVTAEFILK
ncbi:MAG: endonuclease/exonuclease/phosphatase family protein [Verrucomicrobia bacterium]|nr:endonuclease/exonuclease/phosphatase family protein [Verrucomicrobiota bacterium]